jgi:DNA-binding transcriptional regulator LsrR (DeoR family)
MDKVGHLLTSTTSSRTDLDQDRLLVKVAWLYYEPDLTQARIARRMRLLDSAREKGVVRPKDRMVLSWGGTLPGMVNGLRRHPHRELSSVLVIQRLGGGKARGRADHGSCHRAEAAGGRHPAPGAARGKLGGKR